MKLDNKRVIFVGFAFMAISAFWSVYDSIIPLILKNTFELNDAVSGVVMALDNVLALFMLPLFGALSDKVNTRWGRRVPFIFCGTIGACLFTLLMPIAERSASLPFFMVALFLTLLCMATYRSPAVALMPDVTPKPLRSKGNAIINLMGAVGGIAALGAIAALVPKGDNPDYLPIFLFTAAFMLISLFVLLKTTNEPKLVQKMKDESKEYGIDDVPEEDEEQAEHGVKTPLPPEVKKSLGFILASIFLWFMGYNAITTAFSKYANVYWDLEGGSFAYCLMVAQGAAIISFIPIGALSSKIGRRKTILIGITILTVAFGVAATFKTFSSFMFVFFALAGVGWASINVNSYPMVVEMSKGADVGRYTGYYYTFSMAAQIITPILSGAILEYGHILLGSADPNAGYVLLFPYGALFSALSFVTMLFVKHGDNKPEKKTALEAFDD